MVGIKSTATAMVIILTVMFALATGTPVMAASDSGPGDHRPEQSRRLLLQQLPADKEMLFHQTMRDARDRAAALNGEIAAQRLALKAIMAAETFAEEQWQDAADTMQELHRQRHAIMQDAVLTLARSFTAAEREILAEVLERRFGGGRGGFHGHRGTRP
ncbi:MAG: periplasmic heavy metal sensor [Deltaproteobacteria bacterium]|nr:periplasmic heavy metal sensor [Candidatus Anaeroferrophillacea bacterium]